MERTKTNSAPKNNAMLLTCALVGVRGGGNASMCVGWWVGGGVERGTCIIYIYNINVQCAWYYRYINTCTIYIYIIAMGTSCKFIVCLK